jgi:hypothetical protein
MSPLFCPVVTPPRTNDPIGPRSITSAPISVVKASRT